jgi:hypothetical protein
MGRIWRFISRSTVARPHVPCLVPVGNAAETEVCRLDEERSLVDVPAAQPSQLHAEGMLIATIVAGLLRHFGKRADSSTRLADQPRPASQPDANSSTTWLLGPFDAEQLECQEGQPFQRITKLSLTIGLWSFFQELLKGFNGESLSFVAGI